MRCDCQPWGRQVDSGRQEVDSRQVDSGLTGVDSVVDRVDRVDRVDSQGSSLVNLLAVTKSCAVTGRYTIDNVKNCMANPNFCRDLYLKPLLKLGLVTN